MRGALIIAGHHLRRIVRNPGLLLLLMAMPVSLAVIEYGAFGRTAATGTLPPTKVLFLDQDDSLVSGAVPYAFSGGPAKDFFELAHVDSLDEARRLFQRNQAAALIVVPKGFQDAVIAGRPARLGFYRNPIQAIGPEIARNMIEMTALIGNGLYAQAAEPLAKVRALMAEGREPSAAEVGEMSTGFYKAGVRLGSLQGLSAISVAVRRPGKASAQTGFGTDPKQFFAYVFPGLTVFALLFIAQAFAIRLLRDRMRGLQRRIAMTPVPAASVAAGGAIYMVTGLFVLLLVLAVMGVLVFRIELSSPAALLPLGVGFALFAAGLHLLAIALAKSDRGAQFVGGVVILVISLLGGTFVPAESLPAALQSVAMALPNGAAQQGFIDVLVHGQGPAGVGGRLAVVWGWGVFTLAAALIAERRRLRV